jgi:ABC-type glycerol-3-phosphate transport system substrate-binding protein
MKKSIFVLVAAFMLASCGGSGNGSSNPADSTAVKDSVVIDTTNSVGGGGSQDGTGSGDGVGTKDAENIK